LPDYSTYQEVRESEYEELFDSATKFALSSPYTKQIDLNGAKALIIFQKANVVPTEVRTINSTGGFSNTANIIDDNLNTETNHLNTENSPGPIVDFGDNAIRTIKVKTWSGALANSSGSSTTTVNIDFSDSPTGPWIELVNVVTRTVGASGSSNGATTSGDITPATAFRYVRYTASRSGAGSQVGFNTYGVYEVWTAGSGLGTGQMSFQIFNDLTAAWETYSLEISIPLNDSGIGSSSTTRTGVLNSEIRNFPKGAGKVRANLVITDGCDANIGMVKIFS